MKSNEKLFLVNEKEADGLARNMAWEEVKDLEEKEKAFKILWNEKKHLENELKTISYLFEKERQKNFKLKFELDKLKIDKPKVIESNGNILHIRRIINFMEKEKAYTKTDLSKDLMMSTTKIEECIKFIQENNLAKIEYNRAWNKYIRH